MSELRFPRNRFGGGCGAACGRAGGRQNVIITPRVDATTKATRRDERRLRGVVGPRLRRQKQRLRPRRLRGRLSPSLIKVAWRIRCRRRISNHLNEQCDATWKSKGRRGFHPRARAETKLRPGGGDESCVKMHMTSHNLASPWLRLRPSRSWGKYPNRVFSGSICTLRVPAPPQAVTLTLRGEGDRHE